MHNGPKVVTIAGVFPFCSTAPGSDLAEHTMDIHAVRGFEDGVSIQTMVRKMKNFGLWNQNIISPD